MSFSEYIKVFSLFVLLPCIIFIPMISSIVFNTRKLILKQFNTEKEKTHTITKIIILISIIIILIIIGLIIKYHNFN